MVKGEFGPFEYVGQDPTLGWVEAKLDWLHALYSTPVLVWQAINVTVWATCGVWAVAHSWSAFPAAVLVGGGWLVVNLVVLAVAKPLQWRWSVARRFGGCLECGERWASRTRFVRAHRHNCPKSVRWFSLRRLPTFCPYCVHDL